MGNKIVNVHNLRECDARKNHKRTPKRTNCNRESKTMIHSTNTNEYGSAIDEKAADENRYNNSTVLAV